MSAHRHTLAALACVVLAACLDDPPEKPKLIEPEFSGGCELHDCGDYGMCAEANDGAPSCLCEVGFTGERCDVCEPGFHRDYFGRCVTDRACSEQPGNPCGASGTCLHDAGVIACACEPGYEGPRCTLCAPGYGREDDSACLQLVLSPDGTTQPLPSLRCEPTSCGTHGECDDSGGVVSCVCERGYAGTRCSSCAAGFHIADGVCKPDQSCLGTSCDGHGECSATSDGIRCECDEGYAGAHCDGCAEKHRRSASRLCLPVEECTAESCGEHGECKRQAGTASCVCELGYTGHSCDACAFGFHASGSGQCAPDRVCSPSSCPVHATCDDSEGEVECTCVDGYTGTGCNQCATGYVSNSVAGTCVLDGCENNPITGAVTIDFDDDGFPLLANTCRSTLPSAIAEVAFSSLAGAGSTWACSASTAYGLDSAHVMLEAGSLAPAELLFAGRVSRVAFELAGASSLDLQVLGDGLVLRTLQAQEDAHESVVIELEAPITALGFQSRTPYTNRIALDDLEITPAPCP